MATEYHTPFFRFDISADEEIVGHYPQCRRGHSKYANVSGNPLFRFLAGTLSRITTDTDYVVVDTNEWDESFFEPTPADLSTITPNLKYLVVDPRATLTNVLSGNLGRAGLLVDRTFKQILESCSIGTATFHPVLIRYRNRFVADEYYFFQFDSDFSDYINFERTVFIKMEMALPVAGSEVQFDSMAEFLNANTALLSQWQGPNPSFYRLVASTIHLKEDYDRDRDLFNFHELTPERTQYGWINISGRLRQKLVDNDITGINLRQNPSAHIVAPF